MTDEEWKRIEALFERGVAETRRATAEMRRHFDVATEAMEHKVQLVAEAVQAVDRKLDREVSELKEIMDRRFSDTQAMIKFSHAELERRVSRLEDALTELQSRVERLETTAH